MNVVENLSYKHNLSLGTVPAIIAMFLCQWMTHEHAIYIGTCIGCVVGIYIWVQRKRYIPQIILYSTTGVLFLLSLMHVFIKCTCPDFLFAFTIEISTAIPPLLILLNRNRLSTSRVAMNKQRKELHDAIEAGIVSSRVITICVTLHLLIVLLTFLINWPVQETARILIFQIAPLLTFLMSIVFNQLGILYFNRTTGEDIFLPVVNTEGNVIGKQKITEALLGKTPYTIPIVRIACFSNEMLFLIPRTAAHTRGTFETGKTDLPIEDFLLYGESLEQGVHRILQQRLPKAPLKGLRFNFSYHFENNEVNRQIYLFTLELPSDAILHEQEEFKNGKLWILRQIKHNLHQNFFCSNLENELEQLETIIYTREKYKES